jgi:hypothetical protein
VTAREKVFSGIKSALASLPEREARPAVPHGVADPQWLAGEADNVALFKKRAKAAGTLCFDTPGGCLSWLFEQQAKLVYLAEALASLDAKFSEIVQLTHDYTRAQGDEIDAALTLAHGAIAETGAAGIKDMGKVMAALRAKHAAALDMAKAGPIVKAKLSA